MVLLIKNKLASFEDFAHLSNLAGEAHGKQLAKLGGQNLRDAGVPKAKSMPHINLLAEGGSLRAHCSAVLNADLHGLKPGKLFARKVKSAKDDLKHLFSHASRQHRVEPAGGPSDLSSIELACSTAASDVSMTRSLDPSSSSSPTFTVPALSDEDEDEDYLYSLTVVAHSWLAFERLFPKRRALSDPTIEQARHDFCQAIIQSFPDHPPRAPSSQVPSSGNPVDLTPPHPTSPVSPPASLANALTNQPVFGSAAGGKPAQSPEFSDEDLEREFDNFSFHSSQEEEWTSELESGKQNAFNRTLSGMKRELAIPVPKLSSYFSDDSLADSAAHRTLVDPQASCSGASSEVADDSSIYSADQEDGSDEDDQSIAISPPDSPVLSDIGAIIIPPSAAEPLLSTQIDTLTPSEIQDGSSPSIAHMADDTDDVWQALSIYVPRLLTRISEESLADEYEIEATGQAPPLSFRRPLSEYRKHLQPGRQCTSLPNCTDSKPTALSVGEPSDVEPSLATNTDNGLRSSTVVSLNVSFQHNRTLRRVRKFTDLKNMVILPTMQSMSSTEAICDTSSLHEKACSSVSQARLLRRAPGYLDLRKAFGGAIFTQTPSSLPGGQEHSLENAHSFENARSLSTAHSLQNTHSLRNSHSFQSLKRRHSFEERHPSPDSEETCQDPPTPRCNVFKSKPVVPPKPPGLFLRRKKTQPSTVTIQEPSSLCSDCHLASSLPLRSCAKITRSRGKQGRVLNGSTKALRKRLDAICIEPETLHGHPPIRCCQKITSVGELRKGKTLGKLWKAHRLK